MSHDDWLPEEFAAPSPESYRQYLLHCDPLERFSVVSFVWMPGHRTPIHDHTVWGLVGVMRGEETQLWGAGLPAGSCVVLPGTHRLEDLTVEILRQYGIQPGADMRGRPVLE